MSVGEQNAPKYSPKGGQWQLTSINEEADPKVSFSLFLEFIISHSAYRTISELEQQM